MLSTPDLLRPRSAKLDMVVETSPLGSSRPAPWGCRPNFYGSHNLIGLLEHGFDSGGALERAYGQLRPLVVG
jgi:hypothetical protein